MKKILLNTALICTISFFGTSADAAVIDRVRTEGAIVRSNGTGMSANYVYPVTVIRKGQNIEALKEFKPPVFYQGELLSDSDGNTSLEFKMPEKSESGEYIIRVLCEKNIKSFEFKYYSSKERQRLIDRINTGKKEQIEDVLKNNSDILGLHMAAEADVGINGIANRTCAEIEKNQGNVTQNYFTEESFLEFYKKTVVLEAFTQGKESFLIQNGFLDYDEYTGIGNSLVYKEYKETLSSDGVKFVNNGVINAKCSNAEQIFEAFEKNMAYAMICKYKENGYGHINRLLSEYKDIYRKVLEVDFTYYDKLSSSEKITFARSLNVKNISSPVALKEKIESTAKDLYKKDNSAGNSGSSGGGGGKNKVDVSIPSVIPTEMRTFFSDLSDVEWARESIEILAEKNIVNGKGNGVFCPNDKITREEFAKLVCLAFKIETSGATCAFSDVQVGTWYYPYVSALVRNGVINGIDSQVFGTGINITREQMAAIIGRICDVKYSGVEKFSDDEKISDYAKASVYAMKEYGVINGIGENAFNPQGLATRAEAAKVICGAMNKFAK